jgi:cold shock protein
MVDAAVSRGRAKIKGSRKLMQTGTVKFFNTEKGYGFITRPDGDEVFVHYSNVAGSGFRNLDEGQAVEFEIGPGRKGDEALDVRAV